MREVLNSAYVSKILGMDEDLHVNSVFITNSLV